MKRFATVLFFLVSCGGDGASQKVGEPCNIDGAENHCWGQEFNSCVSGVCTPGEEYVLHVCSGACQSDEDCEQWDTDPGIRCDTQYSFCYRSCSQDSECLAETHCDLANGRCVADRAPPLDCSF